MKIQTIKIKKIENLKKKIQIQESNGILRGLLTDYQWGVVDLPKLENTNTNKVQVSIDR